VASARIPGFEIQPWETEFALVCLEYAGLLSYSTLQEGNSSYPEGSSGSTGSNLPHLPHFRKSWGHLVAHLQVALKYHWLLARLELPALTGAGAGHNLDCRQQALRP